ncbi:serine hydrolase domain-containing protein [Streptosporangium amethystogenes]|uniref:serine hydrolase domain-containing protein n=1 Tax=Streptosporangium amethystogenes TaxID=2002 RepID=UPI00068B7BED|nr:serine hydrolase domain-containing protein [Streptosporangium amethystogenes]
MIGGLEMVPDAAVAVLDEDGGLTLTGTDTAQPVFSVTKMFMAVAVLRLVDSGRLTLEDEVSLRVPLAPSGITVRELLNHTGGLPDYATTAPYLDAVARRPDQPWGLERILTVALEDGRSARGRFRYSNLGYWLLGTLVEDISGAPLEQTLAALVFGQAGMRSTFFPASGTGLTGTGYDTRWAGPAGAAWATPRDLVIFLTGLLDGSLLSAQSLTAMTTTVPVAAAGPPWRKPGYGLGLMIDDEYRIFGHGGGGPGYTSAAMITPDRRRSVAVIARSSANVDPTALTLRLLQVDT